MAVGRSSVGIARMCAEVEAAVEDLGCMDDEAMKDAEERWQRSCEL